MIGLKKYYDDRRSFTLHITDDSIAVILYIILQPLVVTISISFDQDTRSMDTYDTAQSEHWL